MLEVGRQSTKSKSKGYLHREKASMISVPAARVAKRTFPPAFDHALWSWVAVRGDTSPTHRAAEGLLVRPTWGQQKAGHSSGPGGVVARNDVFRHTQCGPCPVNEKHCCFSYKETTFALVQNIVSDEETVAYLSSASPEVVLY